jgi:hypothetical protein
MFVFQRTWSWTWSVLPVDQYGCIYDFFYINVLYSKLLGIFLTQPCGTPGHPRVTLATDPGTFRRMCRGARGGILKPTRIHTLGKAYINF